MNYSKVFSVQYIFNQTPSAESRFYPLLLALFGVMILFALVLIFVEKKEKTLLSKFKTVTLTCGILGLVHVFGRYEGLPWICTRFYVLLVLLTFFVWSLIVAIVLIKNLPKHKNQIKTELRYSKYLPKSKNKL